MESKKSCLFAMFVSALFSSFITIQVAKSRMEEFKEQAINNGAAQHNPKTGEFEWIKSTQ